MISKHSLQSMMHGIECNKKGLPGVSLRAVESMGTIAIPVCNELANQVIARLRHTLLTHNEVNSPTSSK
jgi:hypothetical protein